MVRGFQYIPIQPIDTVALERVEFLKGPTGILYGRNDYGGMLNYVTKQPENRDFTSLAAAGGLGGIELGRVEADINNALIDGLLSFRLPMAYEDSENYTHIASQQFTAAPSLRWDATEDLRITLGGVIQSWRTVGSTNGVSPVALGATADDVNWETAASLARCSHENITCVEPPHYLRNVMFTSDADFYKSSTAQGNFKVDYRITDRLDFFATGSYLDAKMKTQQHYVGTLTAEDGTAFLNSDALDMGWRSYSAEAGVTGNFDLFGRTQKFYVGGDYRRYSEARFDYGEEVYEPSFNIFSFRTRDSFLVWLDENSLGRDWSPYDWVLETERRDRGLGAQVVFELAESLSLLVGGRYERSEFARNYSQFEGVCVSTSCARLPGPGFGGAFDHSVKSDIFLPRAGLTWKVVPDRWTAYMSYTEGFIPQSGTTRSGDQIDPETGYQIELGVKGQLFDEALLVSLAFWQIQREGVAVSDPDNVPGGEPFVIGGLGQRNRGIEFEAMGRIRPGLNVILAASKTEGRFDESTDTFFSEREITATPDYKISGYVNQEFLEGSLAGFSLGGGFTTLGPQWGVFPQAFRIDDYSTVDLKVGYAFSDRVQATFQVQNLLDESYVTSRATDWDGCCVGFGDKRSFRLSIATSW